MAGDLDGDDRNLLAVGAKARKASLFLQGKEGGFSLSPSQVWSERYPHPPPCPPIAEAIGDLDGDGLNDVGLVSKELSQVSVYRPGGGALPSSPAQILRTAPGPVIAAIGDLDGMEMDATTWWPAAPREA